MLVENGSAPSLLPVREADTTLSNSQRLTHVTSSVSIHCLRKLALPVIVFLLFGWKGCPPFQISAVGQSLPNATLETSIQELIRRLPEPIHHIREGELNPAPGRMVEVNHREILREKLADKWFAALLDTNPTNAFAIHERLPSWKSLVRFIEDRDALVEVWAYPEQGNLTARRIPAQELAAMKRESRVQPTFLTLTWLDQATQKVQTNRVEFAFNAADQALAAQQSYLRQRRLQIEVNRIFAARDDWDRPSAVAQWNSLQDALRTQMIEIHAIPQPFTDSQDLFVAAEYEVDEWGNFRRIVRLYHESEIRRHVEHNDDGRSTQLLLLGDQRSSDRREARAFTLRGVSDELLPKRNPVRGQDSIELRVKDPGQKDPRKWNVLEFGEPELIRESALAQFSLVNADLDRHRKEIGLKKSTMDLIAEPLILGLNLGGGVSGLGVPAGDVGRLFYNLISTRWIADVPTARELRDLFVVLAAKEQHPELAKKPAEFLTKEDIRTLELAASRLSPQEIQDYLERISEGDVEAMVFIARLQRIDARVSNFLGILTSAGKVSGVTERSKVLRVVFNNVNFSLSGDLNLKTIIALALGHRVATPLSGTSLESLSQGQGPAAAWLQYFDVSIDIRALINTLGRIPNGSFAEKEVKKPLPYATKATDLAAYEVRIFGFPLLLF